jgi:hypothetical protein
MGLVSLVVLVDSPPHDPYASFLQSSRSLAASFHGKVSQPPQAPFSTLVLPDQPCSSRVKVFLGLDTSTGIIYTVHQVFPSHPLGICAGVNGLARVFLPGFAIGIAQCSGNLIT